MKRLFQLLLAAIGILGVVVVAAVVYVTTFLDPEDLKPHLVEMVREHSGLELELAGPLNWSFYPRVGVSIADVKGHLPEQDGESPLLAFDRAEVSLSFATLLRGEVAIEGVTLDGVQLYLERNEAGQGNWEPLLERLESEGDAAQASPAPASAGVNLIGDSNLSVALNVASVKVRNGEVVFRDLGSQSEWLLESFSFTGTNVNPRSDFPLQASFQLAHYGALDWRELERAPALTSEISLDTRARLALAERRYALEGFTLDTATRREGADRDQTATLSGERLVLDLVERKLELVAGQLDSPLQHPALGEEAVPLELDFALDADLADQSARLRDMVLSGPDGLRATGNLELSSLDRAPSYRGELDVEPMSLRPWLERFGHAPMTADAEALSDVALSSPVEGDSSRLALTELDLALDGSTFSGSLDAGLDGRRIGISLQGDSLDLDAYLPPRTAESEDSASRGIVGIERAHAQEDEASLVPAEWLAAVDLDGELTLEHLRFLGLDFTRVELALAGGEGRQRLERFASRFYDGRLSATGELDLTREPIHWQLSPTLSDVSLEPLYRAWQRDDGPAPLRGRLTTEGRLTASGNTMPVLRRHLNGELSARLDEGAISDVNVSRELCTVAAMLEGEEMTRDWGEDTRFDRAALSVTISDGVARSDDIELTLPGIAVNGEGELDLVTERFDLRADTRFVDTADAACRVNPRLERVPLPVRCSGDYTGDSSEWCRFDREAFQETLTTLLREEAGRRAGEAIEERLGGELDERIGEEAGKELRDALRGLFD
ncbi:AsmA family protein [Billgrantia gudaonensis]|uniref:AsmA protein n=1 Tax=Billgrantia gudaonensis TaxID=376427 RepID=A0A1G9E472_9GAMM|nr:AsmA family protein [Halomonas gudaonensis]SDK70922.1 AsmA protein [Halomonas gudaonensis]